MKTDRIMTRSKLRRWAWVTLLAISACGGKTATTINLGGETHFLRHCVDECGSELSCIGGICTRSCLVNEGGNECEGLAATSSDSVSCTAQSVEPGEVGVCDVQCTQDFQCEPFSHAHRCQQGHCRASNLTSTSTDDNSCQGFRDEPPPSELNVRIRNATNGPIFLMPSVGCNTPGPVSIETDRDVSLAMGPSACDSSCEELLDDGYEARTCTAGCDDQNPIRIEAGELYQAPSIAALIENHPIPGNCIGQSPYDDFSVYCDQQRSWPPGELRFIARAYLAVACLDPQACDCQPEVTGEEVTPPQICDSGLVEQPGFKSAVVVSSFRDLAESGLEIIFSGDIR